MKLLKGYYKTTIAGVPYLLSYGQACAERGISLRLNTSGSLLWDALSNGASKDELLALLAEQFDAQEDDLPLLEQDLSNYLETLRTLGILVDAPLPVQKQTTPLYFRIGPLTISYEGCPSFYETYFSAFQCDAAAPVDLSITIVPHAPRHKQNGTILIRTPELTICDCKEQYLFFFEQHWGISEMYVQKDGSAAFLYTTLDDTTDHAEDIFHALRFAFLVCAQNHDLIVLHSASLLYNEHAWLFSGCSGTGKSTHTNLWHDLFGTPRLNGDLNLLGIENGIPMVYGLPWCGTSEIFTSKNYPLGGIVFLKQAPENEVGNPSLDQCILRLLQRLISPSWTKQLCEKNLHLSSEIAEHTQIFTLACTKEPQAAYVMRAAIDADAAGE